MGRRRENPASVTVMLAMMFICLLSLLAGLFSTARLAGTGYYVQMALDSSLDSAMSRYHREAWENYRIFLLPGGQGETVKAAAAEYFSSYMENGYPWQTGDYRLEEGEVAHLADSGGIYFEREVCDYMKTGIWEALQRPEEFSVRAKEILEASSYGNMGISFHGRSRRILSLEKAVDAIAENFTRQEELLLRAKEALREANPEGFYRAADGLLSANERIPGLVEQYEKKADSLMGEMEALERDFDSKRDRMNARDILRTEEELSDYRSYVSTDGERRSMVRALVPLAEENRKVVERAVETAEELEELLEEEEEDDEDDGGGGGEEDEDDDEDDGNPWEAVIPELSGYRIPGEYGHSGGRDKKKIRLLENLGDQLENGLLSLVLPDRGELPKGKLKGTPLLPEGGREGELPLLSSFSGGSLPDRLLLNEYGVQFFSSYVFPARAGVKDYSYRCGLEYLLHGEREEKENLARTAAELLAVREGFNLAALLSDEACRAEAEGAAAAITASSGFMLVPLERVLFYTIVTVWALLESASDVRTLLSGGRVKVLKRYGDFHVSLAQILEEGAGALPEAPSGGGNTAEEAGEGLDYTGWIRFLMLTRNRELLRFRMMDLIAENMSEEGAPVRMENAIYRAGLTAYAGGALLPIRRTSVREY